MTIDENNNKFLTFLTPALLSFGAALLLTVLQVFISIFLVGILMRLPDFSNPLYEPVWNLILLFLSQILSSLIIVFWLIPWLKLRNERQFPLNWNTFLSTLLLICLIWVLIIIKTILIVIPIESLQLEPPRTGLEALIISEEILSPITIIILFAPLVIGAPLFEELVYRRILIPLLEERGMPSIGAVIASSLFFTFLHVPSDLLNGNITGTVLHISSVIILGFVLGISYIKTRNVIYPMLIHGVINGISIVPVVLIEGTELATLYEIFYYTVIIGIGSIYLLYLCWCILKDFKTFKIENMEFKISIINRGFVGYLIISSGLLLLYTISLVFFQVISVLIITPITLIFLLIIIRNTEFRRRELLKSQISQETSLIS